MISYEVAKKLKKAGYPQDGQIKIGGSLTWHPYALAVLHKKEPPEVVCIPTLSELISEVRKFKGCFGFCLCEGMELWIATIVDGNTDVKYNEETGEAQPTHLVYGYSAEQALIELWFVLKKGQSKK